MGEFQKRIEKKIKFYKDGKSPKIVIVTLEDIQEDVQEAKKEIFNAIEEHFEELVMAWENPQKNLAKYKEVYIDAYKCLKHNILKEDTFKLKKWFSEEV